MKETFTSLVQDSKKVLIVGHLQPDFDAYASMLFVYNIIKHNFSNKKIHMCLDTKKGLSKISFLKGFMDIEYGDIIEKVKKIDPDLMIFVDGADLDRYTRDKEKLRKLLKNKKTAMIDHHVVKDTDFTFFYNLQRGSAMQVVYQLLVVEEKLEPYPDWEGAYLTGEIGDSYRFYYTYPGYRENFSVISDILDNTDYTIREISDKLFSYTPEDFAIYKILFNNVGYGNGYAYSVIDWDIYKSEIENKFDTNVYKHAKRFFVDEFLNKLENIPFCFTLVPEMYQNDNSIFTGSFRSKPNTVDCTIFAKYLNGGGHITGAGFEVIADSLEKAKAIVEKVIEEHLEEAKIDGN